MNKVADCDKFKAKEQIYSPDERIEKFVHHNDKNYLNNYYQSIEALSLHEKVPKEVGIQFETAKNVLLYSYFSYRMTTVSHLFMYAVLEKAIKEKFKRAYPEKSDVHYALKKYLKIALKERWIHGSDFYNDERCSNDICSQDVCFAVDSFVKYRNELSHSPEWLMLPYEVINQFRLFQKMINRIFEDSQ